MDASAFQFNLRVCYLRYIISQNNHAKQASSFVGTQPYPCIPNPGSRVSTFFKNASGNTIQGSHISIPDASPEDRRPLPPIEIPEGELSCRSSMHHRCESMSPATKRWKLVRNAMKAVGQFQTTQVQHLRSGVRILAIHIYIGRYIKGNRFLYGKRTQRILVLFTF